MPDSAAPDVLRTARLRLDPLAPADLAAVHAIYADPVTWRHLPAGRHTTLAQTERMLDESEQSWSASGLGRWAIRLRAPVPGVGLAAGALIGVASATLTDCGARNVGYRLTPASWGVGLATEAATAVLAVAQTSDYPVTARALASNPASVRVLERIGLTRVWSGRGLPGATIAPVSGDAGATPAPGHPDSTALERVIFADRPLAPELLAAIIRLG
ncbi:GNAT family N-acetyltransferase [Cryobacterium sp. SO2]|uniref:GNAT family N-acetyltransferase n=1 Tax=Cryobacterium sp. SO2 TaxID=1897060 RepID=UPI00223D6D34|nr:GNAT family N-acetyltransferase [Cryobacterium sp. SO2]WEO77097.1 GNAT family N-acetyltransferase [Cryobacterium sp. SO2]